MTNLERISGAEQLIARFGRWPSFHDAEVTRMVLDRRGPDLEFTVHVWTTTEALDDRAFYILINHTLVTIRLERLASVDLSDFNRQNVLFGLVFEAENIGDSAGFRVTFDSSYGVSGTATCARVVIVDATACDQSGEMMTDLEQS